MSNIRLSTRYAKSLLELCEERNEIDVVNGEMKALAAQVRASRELQAMLASPVISGDKKLAVLRAVFTNVSVTTQSFMNLVVNKGRSAVLADIARAFVNLVQEKRGIHNAELITAVKADDTLKAEVIAMAGKIAGGTIELEEKLDPAVLGGFILRVDGKEYNASIASKLKEVKKEFSLNPHVPSM